MKDPQRENSLVDSVFDRILDFLQRRGLTGSETLRVASLAEELGVSRTPVSMALVRLECEGLIRKTGGRGWTTVPLSLEDIEGIFDLKELLEPFEARRAAENVTPEAGAVLLSIVDEMDQACAAKDSDAWLTADRRYHDLLQDIAGNRELKRFQRQLNYQLHRLEVGHLAMEGRLAEGCKEHRAVAEATAAGNPDLAAENARDHIRALRESMIGVLKDVLMPFLGEEF